MRLYKLFLTERKLAKICANGVTIKSSTWLARSFATDTRAWVVDDSAASLILERHQGLRLRIIAKDKEHSYKLKPTFHSLCLNSSTWIWVTFQNLSPNDKETIRDVEACFGV